MKGGGGLYHGVLVVGGKGRVGGGLGETGGVMVRLRSRGGESVAGGDCGPVSEMKTTSGDVGGWTSYVGMVVSSGWVKGCVSG